MNSKIYGKLAVTNLKNNGKSYVPYILASAFSVMMYFIMDNLYRNRSLVEKGSPLAIMLSYADVVLLIFSVIFLFYINSFLIKRRKKELGIYNILGMGKGHLGKMLFLESVMTTAASITAPIIAASGVSPILGAVACCVGSLFFGYFNDSYFWVVNRTLGVSEAKDQLRIWSVTSTVAWAVGVVEVLILNIFM